CYDREQFEALARRPLPERAQRPDDWLVPLAQRLDPDRLKFPLVLVQEYGWSLFRIAATATLALTASPHCELRLNTKATELAPAARRADPKAAERAPGEGGGRRNSQGPAGEQQDEVVFLVSAWGFRTGLVDDVAGYRRQRLVEYKAAYLARWPVPGQWPEVIF